MLSTVYHSFFRCLGIEDPAKLVTKFIYCNYLCLFFDFEVGPSMKGLVGSELVASDLKLSCIVAAFGSFTQPVTSFLFS